MEYSQRLKRLRNTKIEQTCEKLRLKGSQDEDDYGCIIPPKDFKWNPPVVDDDGGFWGTFAWGKNFRSLMESHPVTIDPDDALAGRWMFMMSRIRPGYRLELSTFPFDYSQLHERQHRYDITPGIGKDAHFAPDYRIGLDLGWGGLLKKIRHFQKVHTCPESVELLNAEEDAILGIQNWISRSADLALEMSENESNIDRRENLIEIAAINRKLVSDRPDTLREACQWIAWFNMASRTYNRDGAGGQLDEILLPYYQNDIAEGRIDDEDAIFYIACLLLNDPHYYQLGGPNAHGRDVTSKMSFLILEAAHRLKVSCNLTIRVHDGLDPELFRKGVHILMENRMGYPRFSGDKALVAGFMKNGYSAELARQRIAVGCNWMAIPGREYTLNDVVKINIAKVFEVAFRELTDSTENASLEALESLFVQHLRDAVACTAEGIDFHLSHQYRNEPELLLNLLSYGPIEKGLDASHGGVDFYNMAIDGAGLATVADSFAAIEQRIENECRLTWHQLRNALDHDYASAEGEKIRRIMATAKKYGEGNSFGDRWAIKLTDIFTELVKMYPVPDGRNLIPGWFSWADAVRFGRNTSATPNGRKAGAPISHGANPDPGFRKDGALTAIVHAVASVQPGYGNTAPLQLEISPCNCDRNRFEEIVGILLKTHFDLGGTLININIIDADTILDANVNPEKYPDLLVRVTGFSAYFANLSADFRQLVVNRIIKEAV